MSIPNLLRISRPWASKITPAWSISRSLWTWPLSPYPEMRLPEFWMTAFARTWPAAHFFSAGFSETNTEEGMTLERRLVKKAEKAGFHLIGPNCMGLFNPRVGIKQSEEQYTGASGPLGFISQSGSIAIGFSLDGHDSGVGHQQIGELRQWGSG